MYIILWSLRHTFMVTGKKAVSHTAGMEYIERGDESVMGMVGVDIGVMSVVHHYTISL
jgi:hypothetical protein